MMIFKQVYVCGSDVYHWKNINTFTSLKFPFSEGILIVIGFVTYGRWLYVDFSYNYLRIIMRKLLFNFKC